MKELPDVKIEQGKEESAVDALLDDIGLEKHELAPKILKRLELLDELTETVEDARKIVKLARKFIEYYETKKPGMVSQEFEERDIIIGVSFSDIGKSGPITATSEQQRFVAEMYAVENIFSPEETSVEKFFNDNFKEEAVSRIEGFNEMIGGYSEYIEKGLEHAKDERHRQELERVLAVLRLGSKMTMRQFINLHARWTKDIVEGDGVPPEAIAAAATHHILEGVNQEVLDEQGKFTEDFGHNKFFSREEKLIIILDKFDAAVRRSGRSVEEAIDWVRDKKLKTNPKYAEDPEFKTLLEDFRSFINDEKIFFEEQYRV